MATLVEEVEDRIGEVENARDAAIVDLEGRWLQTDAVEASIRALKSLNGSIESWAAKGRNALPEGKPGAGGWPGWISGGNHLLAGIADITDDATAETLANIEATAAGVRDDTVRVAKKAAATAEAAAQRASAAVGNAAGAIARPLTLPLAAIAVGLVAVAVIFVKVKP